MATAKKLDSGSWRCLAFIGMENGKRKYKSFTAPTKKEAEYMATEYLMEQDQKKQKKTEDLFCNELSKYISSKEAVLSPSTIKGYKALEKMLTEKYPHFCDMKISDIEQEHVQNVISDLAKTKSPKTVRNYHGLISAVIGPNLNLNTSMPQRVQPDLYIPSDDEIRALVKGVRDSELEIPVLLGAFCMMRRGEICALDIKKDISGNTIHVHHSLVLGPDKEWHLKAPKTTSSDRFIEAPQFVIDRIKEVGYITHLNPHSITIMFQRVLKKNNIPHFRFHDLRHYSASIRHALGIPDAYIMADGGWCSDKVLKAVYRHAMSDRKKEMSDKANSHFESLF